MKDLTIPALIRELIAACRVLLRHESAHCVAGELLGWSVVSVSADLKTGEGLTTFERRRVAPLVNVIASCAGHAVELARHGRIDCASVSDRQQTLRALRRFCKSGEYRASDVRELEGRFALVFAAPDLRELVDDVACELARFGTLDGDHVRAATGWELSSPRLRRQFRACCVDLVIGFIQGVRV
jgi:hypothetical protein